jgi:predicted enzyme related to lactoylglutathione lyase
MTSGSREHPFGHGRIAYVQIPALDVSASAAFYREIFGWQLSGGSASHASFIDATENVLGAFVTDRAVSHEAGVILYVYVHGIDATLEKMFVAGSKVIKSPYPEGDIWVATLTDPAGNVIGIWQFSPR